MKKYVLLLVCTSAIFWACSDDNEPLLEQDQTATFQMTAVGDDGQNLFQLSINSQNGDSTVTNLTEELAIDGVFLTLRQLNDELSFFSFRDGLFSWAKKDVKTNASLVLNDFYQNIEERSIVWGINSPTTIYFGYFGPAGTRNLAIYGQDQNSGAFF